MATNKGKVLEAVEQLTFEKELPPTKKEVTDYLDVSEKTVQRHTRDLEERGDIRIFQVEGENKNRYAPSDFEPPENKLKPLGGEIRDAINHYRELGLRDPILNEVAVHIGRNPESEAFKTVFYRVAGEVSWSEPSDTEIQEAKSGVQEKVESAVALEHNLVGSSRYPHDNREEVKEYLEANREIIEKINWEREDIETRGFAVGEDEEGNKTKSAGKSPYVVVEAPRELEKFIEQTEFKLSTTIEPDNDSKLL